MHSEIRAIGTPNQANNRNEKNAVLRAQIQFLTRHGLKTKVVAEKLKVNLKTVHKWMKRTSITDSPNTGRPAVVLSQETKLLITSLCKDQWNASVRMIAKTLNNSNDFQSKCKTISPTTVSRYVRSTDWGRTAFKQKTAPMLTFKNIQDRLSFSSMVMDKGYCANNENAVALIDHILFTDESIIELYPKPNSQNTRIRTTNPELRSPIGIPKNGLKIMVAGGMSAHGLTALHICGANTTVNGEYYREKIVPLYSAAKNERGNCRHLNCEAIFTDPDKVVLMQDGAPAHTAKLTMELLGGEFATVWGKGTWPGNSPDLNPIEHIWALLQESVFHVPRPRTRSELIERIEHTWGMIGLETTKKLVYSFPKRIQQCLNRCGRSTDY